MKATSKRSEFARDIDELMDEYVPTEHKFNGMHMHVSKKHRGVDITTGPVSAGALTYDKDTGAIKLYDGSHWIDLSAVTK
jgi:hypothetical protein